MRGGATGISCTSRHIPVARASTLRTHGKRSRWRMNTQTRKITMLFRWTYR